MRYLKYFEAKETPYELLEKYGEDIIKVLSKYYSTHTGDICDQINELIWNSSDDASERLENNDTADEECIRLLINDLKGGGARNVEKLLDIYYDCRPFVKVVDADFKKKIEEVFFDLSDDGDFNISKISNYNDDRYKVQIKLKDIFKKINFYEITSRLEDLGFSSYSVDGVKNGNLEYINMEFWKPLSKELRDELGLD